MTNVVNDYIKNRWMVDIDNYILYSLGARGGEGTPKGKIIDIRDASKNGEDLIQVTVLNNNSKKDIYLLGDQKKDTPIDGRGRGNEILFQGRCKRKIQGKNIMETCNVKDVKDGFKSNEGKEQAIEIIRDIQDKIQDQLDLKDQNLINYKLLCAAQRERLIEYSRQEVLQSKDKFTHIIETLQNKLNTSKSQIANYENKLRLTEDQKNSLQEKLSEMSTQKPIFTNRQDDITQFITEQQELRNKQDKKFKIHQEKNEQEMNIMKQKLNEQQKKNKEVTNFEQQSINKKQINSEQQNINKKQIKSEQQSISNKQIRSEQQKKNKEEMDLMKKQIQSMQESKLLEQQNRNKEELSLMKQQMKSKQEIEERINKQNQKIYEQQQKNKKEMALMKEEMKSKQDLELKKQLENKKEMDRMQKSRLLEQQENKKEMERIQKSRLLEQQESKKEMDRIRKRNMEEMNSMKKEMERIQKSKLLEQQNRNKEELGLMKQQMKSKREIEAIKNRQNQRIYEQQRKNKEEMDLMKQQMKSKQDLELRQQMKSKQDLQLKEQQQQQQDESSFFNIFYPKKKKNIVPNEMTVKKDIIKKKLIGKPIKEPVKKPAVKKKPVGKKVVKKKPIKKPVKKKVVKKKPVKKPVKNKVVKKKPVKKPVSKNNKAKVFSYNRKLTQTKEGKYRFFWYRNNRYKVKDTLPKLYIKKGIIQYKNGRELKRVAGKNTEFGRRFFFFEKLNQKQKYKNRFGYVPFRDGVQGPPQDWYRRRLVRPGETARLLAPEDRDEAVTPLPNSVTELSPESPGEAERLAERWWDSVATAGEPVDVATAIAARRAAEDARDRRRASRSSPATPEPRAIIKMIYLLNRESNNISKESSPKKTNEDSKKILFYLINLVRDARGLPPSNQEDDEKNKETSKKILLILMNIMRAKQGLPPQESLKTININNIKKMLIWILTINKKITAAEREYLINKLTPLKIDEIKNKHVAEILHKYLISIINNYDENQRLFKDPDDLVDGLDVGPKMLERLKNLLNEL